LYLKGPLFLVGHVSSNVSDVVNVTAEAFSELHTPASLFNTAAYGREESDEACENPALVKLVRARGNSLIWLFKDGKRKQRRREGGRKKEGGKERKGENDNTHQAIAPLTIISHVNAQLAFSTLSYTLTKLLPSHQVRTKGTWRREQ
jgi:hypothetical protein